MTPQQEKRLALINTIVGTAMFVHDAFIEPIPNIALLRKRPFPNRNIPHRIKRKLKNEARAARAVIMARVAVRSTMGAASISAIMAKQFSEIKYAVGGLVSAAKELTEKMEAATTATIERDYGPHVTPDKGE